MSTAKMTRQALFGLSIFLLGGCGAIKTFKARQLARDGNSLYLQGQYSGAIEKYKQALALEPTCPNLHLNLGYSYFSLYNPDSVQGADNSAAQEAVRYFELHLQTKPDDENARVFLIKTLLKASPRHKDLADRAQTTFLAMLAKNPNDHEARQYLITLFIECKRYEDAVKFFEPVFAKKPDDVETMKILAIIADKSNLTQEAVNWYWKRGDSVLDPNKKAMMFYEVGTYAWNTLHYQPDRATGIEGIKLVDQGIEACLKAMKLKDQYAEAMVYTNLLYLKRTLFEPDDLSRSWDQMIAFEYRKKAGEIMQARKETEQKSGAPAAGTPEGATPGGAPGTSQPPPTGAKPDGKEPPSSGVGKDNPHSYWVNPRGRGPIWAMDGSDA